MTITVRTERYKRGFFGWIFKIIFVGFNLFMAAWMILTWSAISKNGGGAGAGIFYAWILLWIWAPGAFVLGLLSYMTRGRKVIVEETVGSA